MPTNPKQAMIVTLSGDHPIGQVVQDLKAAGFEVEQVLDVIGSVTGNCDRKIAGKLRAIAGVADVSIDHPIDIGPPGEIS